MLWLVLNWRNVDLNLEALKDGAFSPADGGGGEKFFENSRPDSREGWTNIGALSPVCAWHIHLQIYPKLLLTCSSTVSKSITKLHAKILKVSLVAGIWFLGTIIRCDVLPIAVLLSTFEILRNGPTAKSIFVVDVQRKYANVCTQHVLPAHH